MIKLSVKAEVGRDLDGRQEEQGKRTVGSVMSGKQESLEGLTNLWKHGAVGGPIDLGCERIPGCCHAPTLINGLKL